MEQTNQATTEQTVKSRTLYFDNRLPIRIKGEWSEIWLGYVTSDFGGRYLRAYKNRKGEYIIWHRFNSPYSDGKSYSTFIGKFRPGVEDAMSKFPLSHEMSYTESMDNTTMYFTMPDRNKIQEWLEGMNLSKVEQFD